MATLLRMPEVAANATHATLQGWTKKEGDAVALGDCIAEIETDKALVELNAEAAGVMGRQLIGAGQSVEVGAPIGVLLANGESGVDVDALIAAATPAGNMAAASAPTAHTGSGGTASDTPPAPHTRHFASPLARRIAAQEGVDLGDVTGSGPNGRIVKHDIMSAVAARGASAAVTAAVTAAAVSPAAGVGTGTHPANNSAPLSTSADSFVAIPHSNMRRIIAQRLSESKSTIPHFYLTAECRMDRLLALRAEVNADASRKISINDFIVRAVAVALREVPEANVSWTDTAMLRHHHADIAVAVSTDAGLITPIVRAAETKSLLTISAEIADLATRARASKLSPHEYQGGSFSVSNLGMYGVAEFSAIINPPQAAILAIGATQASPVVVDGAVQVAQTMRCTLSVDHRAIDGALAAQWLAVFKRLIDNPLSMLI